MFDYAESPISTQRRFRISELTSNVPYAVRSTLRNDGKGDFRINSVVCKTTAIKKKETDELILCLLTRYIIIIK